jgi:hypothetical protein
MKLTDEELQGNQTERLSLIMRSGDLSARFKLLDLAEREYELKNWDGCACLMHAMMYLTDRLAYEVNPPPTKHSILLTLTADEGRDLEGWETT